MGFDYDKIKSREGEHGSWWTSYADLFMMLSVVFLLLYVATSLRSGSAGVQQQIEYDRLAKRAEELEEQIRVYNTLKDEQLKGSSDDEQKVYSQLMDKLSLLRDEARDEKEDLRRRAKENEQKEFALNQYQQVVRNIIDANILAKAQIKRRDTAIVDKDRTIGEKNQEIDRVSAEVAQRERVIAENERKIHSINSELDHKIRQLSEHQKQARSSRQQLNKAIEKLKKDGQQRIAALRGENQAAQTQLDQARSQLNQAQTHIVEVETKVAQTEEQKGLLQRELQATKSRYLNEIAGLQKEHDEALSRERAAFEANLKKQRLGADARARKLAEFTANANRKAQALEGQIASLNSKVRETEGQLQGAERDKSRYLASIEGLNKEKTELTGDLERARALANARKNLANAIMGNFAKAGIKAQVDGKTGDVTLDFGEDYFDAGSSNLKPTMENRLQKFIPSYAASLFNDPKTAEKISNVEIIGFASPTYKGRYVNPKSLKIKDQQAVNYNLKLSFSRANAIFKYIFNPTKLRYAHQETLLPMVKVVGRGFLPEGKDGGDIADGLPEEAFCKQYNCKRAQRVIIKFNLKD